MLYVFFTLTADASECSAGLPAERVLQVLHYVGKLVALAISLNVDVWRKDKS